MEQIKEGEYVRTQEGFIAKCIEIDEDGDYFTFDHYVEVQYGDEFFSLYDDELNKILKHSKNIIDLIEVDDIVEVLDNAVGFKAKIHIYDNLLLETVKEDIQNKNYELIGIASHELFESIKYEV